MLVFVVSYFLYTMILAHRTTTVGEIGIEVTNLIRTPKTVLWAEIDHSSLARWIDGKPFEIHVYGPDSPRPLAKVPVCLYSGLDSEYLMNLPQLKLQR